MPHPTKGRSLSCSSFVLASVLFCQYFISTPAARAQYGGNQQGLRANEVQHQSTCIAEAIEVTVFSDAKAKIHLDREAVARLYDRARKIENWGTVTPDAGYTFCVERGEYDLDVSAAGYLTEHKAVQVESSLSTAKVQVILQKDPTAVDLNASDANLSPKIRADVKRAEAELKNSNLKEAHKRLEKAYSVAPSSTQINFLLGYLFFQQKDWDKSESYLIRAALWIRGRCKPSHCWAACNCSASSMLTRGRP